jgi:hypothetical protein
MVERFDSAAGPKIIIMNKDKKNLIIVLALLIAGLIFAGHADMEQYPQHACYDSTHKTCDGECKCDGLGCTK